MLLSIWKGCFRNISEQLHNVKKRYPDETGYLFLFVNYCTGKLILKNKIYGKK